MKNKILVAALVAIAASSALIYAQRKGEPMQTFEVCDVPQSEVWENVKYAKGEGFQVFTFEFTQTGQVNIRAVRGGGGRVGGGGGGIVGIGGDGEELRITCSAPTTGSLIVQVDYYTISS